MNELELECDVAIVGAGPAGAATAIALAREGVDVLVVDAQRFPRFKPCGEFMSPQCLPLLEELGAADALRAAGAREVRGMHLQGWGRGARGAFVDVGSARAPCDFGWALRREEFDHVLLEHARAAGARVVEGLRMRALLRSGDGAVIGFEGSDREGRPARVRARWTVGADGVRSRVARELGARREDPTLQRIAFTTRYRGAQHDDLAQAHFFDQGYFALAPVARDVVSVNLVLFMDEFDRERLPRDEAFESWLARTPSFAERLAGAERIDPLRGVGPMAAHTSEQAFDGAALVGDAAGYVDPITGEGIYFALQGAALLARCLLDARGDARAERRALEPYLAGRRRHIAPRARLCRRLLDGLRRPRLARAAFALVQARPGLADLAVSMAGDYAAPRELARPSVWLRALRRREPA